MNIYLSSTLDDLRDYRERVMDALRKDQHLVLDSYEATPEPTLEQCLRDVVACDVYVGLFAWRYGWQPPGTQESITALEYRAAVAAGKPRLVFMRPLRGWPGELIDDPRERIVALRRELGEGTAQTPNEFTDENDLALKVSRAVRRIDDQRAAHEEAPNRARAAGRGNSLMEPAAPPHPHRLAHGMLLLGVQGSDDAALQRLHDAMPAAWRTATRAFAPEIDADLAPLDGMAANARCAALLVTPASLARLRLSAAANELASWLGERLGGFFVLGAGVAADALPPAWPVRAVLPISQWLASPVGTLGGELADLQAALRAQEFDLEDEALVGLACTTLAMTAREAEALASNPALVRERLGSDAYDYFVAVTARLAQPNTPWTARYGQRRGLWRPFGTQSADDLLREAVRRLNKQPFFTGREHAALLGNRVRLRPYPFDPARLQDDTAAAAAYEAMRARGCLVLIDELSMLHPELRPYGSIFASDLNATVATLSPLDPSATALDRLVSVTGPFNIGALVDRFGNKLDPRCELSINSPARLRRWLRLAILETLASAEAQTADPDRRDAFRRLAFGT
jgi:hypothetical protein